MQHSMINYVILYLLISTHVILSNTYWWY